MPNFWGFFFLLFLCSCSLLQTPSSFSLLSLCMFKGLCSVQICLSEAALCAATSDLGNGATNSSLGPVDLLLYLKSVSGRTSAWNLLFLGMPLLSGSHGRSGRGAKLRFFFFLCSFSVFLICLSWTASGYCLGFFCCCKRFLSLVQVGLFLWMAVKTSCYCPLNTVTSFTSCT